MTNEIKQVMEKLDTIKSELSDIKKHMVDIDSIMTEEDYLALIDYRKENRQWSFTFDFCRHCDSPSKDRAKFIHQLQSV